MGSFEVSMFRGKMFVLGLKTSPVFGYFLVGAGNHLKHGGFEKEKKTVKGRCFLLRYSDGK